jgi:hypothetical protein
MHQTKYHICLKITDNFFDIVQLTPSTISGWPPAGLAAPFWFTPNPVEGVLATSSMSFIIILRTATCISPNNLESCYY